MNESPIEEYLDQLFEGLRNVNVRDARSLLAETEAHLRDLADTLEHEGVARFVAEAEAVRRFGDARRLASDDRWRSRPRLATSVLVTTWTLGALGAVAVGASGVLAGLLRVFGVSNSVLAGQPSAADLTRADCSRWLAIYPHAASCANAATADWAAEAVGYRIAFGMLGLIALGALALARRFRPQLRGASLPPLMVDTIAALAFAASGVWLAGMGIDAVVVASSRGAGQWLTAAPVALAAATWFGLRLVRDLRPATSPTMAS